ncbi:hypothetical protein OF83DRAFT_1180274 [Amylostereum chailletii]|nr:hypothetical protein OF83DRAFT_1180274 [Amylostereum chailletii]
MEPRRPRSNASASAPTLQHVQDLLPHACVLVRVPPAVPPARTCSPALPQRARPSARAQYALACALRTHALALSARAHASSTPTRTRPQQPRARPHGPRARPRPRTAGVHDAHAPALGPALLVLDAPASLPASPPSTRLRPLPRPLPRRLSPRALDARRPTPAPALDAPARTRPTRPLARRAQPLTLNMPAHTRRTRPSALDAQGHPRSTPNPIP